MAMPACPWRGKRAPVRLGPHRIGEPAYSVLERLAKANGYDSGRQMAVEQGMLCRKVQTGGQTDRIATLADMDPDSLRASTPIHSPSHALLGNSITTRRMWRRNTIMYCPHCVAADRIRYPERADCGIIRRVWWDCHAVHRCPEHGNPLVDSRIEDPSKATTTPTTEKCVDGMSVSCGWERYLIGRMGFLPPTPSSLLDSLPLDIMIDCVGVCGTVGIFGKNAPIIAANLLSDSDVLDRGFRELSSVGAFRRFLDAIWSDDIGRWGVVGLPSAYGSLYRWLACNRNATRAAPISVLIRDHAEAEVPLRGRSKILGASHARSDRPLLGMTRDKKAEFVRNAVSIGLLDERHLVTDERRIALPSSARKLVEAHQASLVSGKDLERRLRLPKDLVSELIHAGLLSSSQRSHGKRPGSFRISTDAGAAFLRRIGAATSEVEEAPAGTATIVRAARLARASVLLVVEALHAGRIKAVGQLSGVDGFPSILVAVDDVAELVSEECVEPLVTFSDAAAELGVAVKTLQNMTRDGIINCCKIGGPTKDRRHYISRTKLELFKSEFVVGNELRSKFGIKRNKLPATLKKYNLQDPFPSRKFYYPIVRRSDLSNFSLRLDHGAVVITRAAMISQGNGASRSAMANAVR